MEIIYTSHSIANRFSDRIEINKHLKKYPHLLNPILEHEQAHTNKFWSKEDFKMDFLSNSKVNHLSLIKFMFRHPLSFLQLSPIIFSRKGFIIDVNLMIMYGIMLLTFMSTIYFGVKYL